MKVATNRLYALALGLSYLIALPIQAGIDWATVSRYLKSKSFFLSYMYSKIAPQSISTVEKPFEMPNPMPTPENIADTLAQHINPHTFLRGASTSEHQCSKRCTPNICSWSRFAQERGLAQPTDKEYSINWWDHYRSYIDYAKNTVHLNAIRFSIEWPLVQPKNQTSFDEETLKHYADLFAYALKQNITPLVCFHHYTDPCWFLDNGGFDEDKNVAVFVEYCTHTYKAIMSHVAKNSAATKALQKMHPREPLWATFNAPEGYAFRGYRQHQGPPADPNKSGLENVSRVLKNELEAHVQTYYALKKSHLELGLEDLGIKPPMVGLLKNIHQLDADQSSWSSYVLSPVTKFMCSFIEKIQNGSIYSFFTTGKYNAHIPFVTNVQHDNPNAIGTLDFIGLNHYSNRHMFLTQTINPTNPDECSDNPVYYRYPQGMYRAIIELSEKLAHPLRIPLYVAENGIATNDDTKRYKFYHEYLYAITKAAQDGYPVQGYFPWTLASNYEWPALDSTVQRDYGMCSVDPKDPSRLTIKKGSLSYTSFADRLKQHTTPLHFIKNELNNVTKILELMVGYKKR